MIVGYNSADSDFNAIGKTGGAKTVTLNVNQIPSHSHTIKESNGVSGGTWNLATEKSTGSNTTSRINNTGGGQAHQNMPPYITASLWRRVA